MQDNQTKRRRVLIVDDDYDFTESLKELLILHHYDAESAYSIEGATSINAIFKANVALLDVRLKAEDGIELISSLKSQKSDMLCIMMTAYRSIDTTVNALRHGVYDYLTKPLHPEELLAALDRSFDKLDLEFQRKQSQIKLQQVNCSLRALNACNATLVRVNDELELFKSICNIIINIAGYRAAWIGLVMPNTDNEIEIVAHAGVSNEFIKSIQSSLKACENEGNPTTISISSGQPYVANNILLDPCSFAWCNLARSSEFKSIIALPLIEEMRIFGSITIYSEHSEAFDKEEVHLLNKLATDLAFGIKSMRAQNHRKKLEKQLQQAQKMEAIGQLTGGIAHDFNNILTSVMGFTSLALKRSIELQDDILLDYLQEVQEASERARKLISQMLTYSRNDSSEPRKTPLKPIVKEVVKMLKSTLPPSIGIYMNIEGSTPSIYIDPTHLHQLIMNLCMNASDAMDGKGQVDIKVERILITEPINMALKRDNDASSFKHCCSCHEEILSGDYIVLSVSDTGTGIDKSNLSQIFEPFFSTKDVGSGSGMGLSMVHGIAHKNNGHILIDTSLGLGTTLYLLFPELVVNGESSKNNIQPIKRLQKKYPTNARILVVNSNDLVARFTSNLFLNYGYNVKTVNNSHTALDLFNKSPNDYDLLVTEQSMPSLSGSELAYKIREIKPKIPIILETDDTINENIKKTKPFERCRYITNSIQANLLLKLAAELLQSHA